MLLVAACTDKQTDGNTVSGLNPADFRMEVMVNRRICLC